MTLRGKRVLVTGGAGFVGSHIVDLLLAQGSGPVTVIDNLTRGQPANLARALGTGRVRLVRGDIRDRALMARLVADSDIVFHQAALRITQCAAEPRAALEVMVDATFDLLTLCVEHGVEKVVAASSASVYGLAESFPTAEDHHPYANRTLYGAAKLFNEGLLRSFNDMHGLRYAALRYFNVYGPRMDIHGVYTEVLIRWMERIEAGEPPLVLGTGRQTMDFVHVRDVARANLLAAEAEASDVALNVGSGVETSLLELAGHLTRVMERPDLRPVFGPERKVNAVSRRLADTNEAARRLGFRTSIGLEEGLGELVDWWRGERGRSATDSGLAQTA